MINLIKTKGLAWIDIHKPDEKDVQFLTEKFNFHPLVLKEIMPPLDHPKIEGYRDYLYIVFYYPSYEKFSRITFPLELDIIVGKNYIITNHYQTIIPLKALFDRVNLFEEVRSELTDEGPGQLLYRIIDGCLKNCFPKIDNINKNLDFLEKEIFAKHLKEAIPEISIVKRDILNFQRVIEPQKLVLEEMVESSSILLGEKFRPYFRNLIGTFNHISNLLKTCRGTIEALDSTNQSLLSTKTNEIIKVLTIFTVILTPLALIANLYGMNLEFMPLSGRRFSFWIVLGILFILGSSMLVWFKKKKWL